MLVAVEKVVLLGLVQSVAYLDQEVNGVQTLERVEVEKEEGVVLKEESAQVV